MQGFNTEPEDRQTHKKELVFKTHEIHTQTHGHTDGQMHACAYKKTQNNL